MSQEHDPFYFTVAPKGVSRGPLHITQPTPSSDTDTWMAEFMSKRNLPALTDKPAYAPGLAMPPTSSSLSLCDSLFESDVMFEEYQGNFSRDTSTLTSPALLASHSQSYLAAALPRVESLPELFYYESNWNQADQVPLVNTSTTFDGCLITPASLKGPVPAVLDPIAPVSTASSDPALTIGPALSLGTASTYETLLRSVPLLMPLPLPLTMPELSAVPSPGRLTRPTPGVVDGAVTKNTQPRTTLNAKFKRKRNPRKQLTDDQKQAHNKIERNYRNNINARIIALKLIIPWLSSENLETKVKNQSPEAPENQRLNKSLILEKATEYILHIQSELDRLTAENEALRQAARS